MGYTQVLSDFIAGHPRFIITVIVLLTLISGYYASQTKIGVDTGRFELKNDAYRTYNDIMETFGSEEDNVIIVSISHSGYILHKRDMLDILRLEEEINGSVEINDMQSLVDYLVMGVHLLDVLEELPENVSVKFDPAIFHDFDKIRDAISNYEYISSVNESARNDSYRVFVLLPSMASGSLAPAGPGNFSYVFILNESSYRDTVYNATTILIDEIELYQNLSMFGAGNISVGTGIPKEYNLTFLNESIEQVKFNITRDKIGMEHYNTTYLEWYSFNTTFSFALSLLYSGQSGISLAIYRASRDVMLNNIRAYWNLEENWTSYRDTIHTFLHGGDLNKTINETERMKNRSFGTLRSYLDNYTKVLKDYRNGFESWENVARWTRWTENVSSLLINYSHKSRERDLETLPVLNGTIEDIERNSGSYHNATKLVSIAGGNLHDVVLNIGYFYGERFIFSKVLDILQNLKSILLRDESSSIKQYAWDLLSFEYQGGDGGESGNITAFYDALKSYRRWIHTDLYENFTSIMWDYLSLEPFDYNLTREGNFSYDLSFDREDMVKKVQNMSQEEIDEDIEKVRNFDNSSVESRIKSYSIGINQTRENLTRMAENLTYIREKYYYLARDDSLSFVSLLDNMKDNVTYGMDELDTTEEQVYSLRMVEEFFHYGRMYFDTLLSEDMQSTIIIIGILDSDYEMEIHDIVKDHRGKVEYHTLASKVLIRQIEKTATEDMRTFLPLSLLLLMILLYITYGTLRHVVLSLLAVLIALTWLFAFATLLGWDFDPILLAVPIMMVGIGIDDGIYVTLRYMEERSTKTRERATAVTVASVGGALILTTITSMVGFLSNTISNMEDLRRFGILAAAGLFFSFVVMNTFLPAANMLVDNVKRKKEVSLRAAQIGARIALKNPYIVIIIALIVSLAGISSLEHINTEFNVKDLAPADSEIIRFYHYYQDNFNASVEISYIYVQGNLSSPEILKAMAEVERNIQDDKTVVHEYSVVSPWSIMHAHATARRGEAYYNESFIRLFRESDLDGDGIPDRNITKLYEMLEPEISMVLKGKRGIFIIHTDSQDLKRVHLLMRELREDARPLEKYAKVKIAGDAIVEKASIDEINENQVRSLTISVAFAIVMLVFLFVTTKRSVTLGIIAAIPILLVVTWNWLLMFILGISLNVMTNTIASLCVGLGVDYGIHITHRFVEESYRYHSISKAILRATGNLGRGMIGASATTISAIGILTLSSIPPLSDFALILSFSILFSFLSSIIVLPSLLVIWSNCRRKHGYDRVHREVEEALRRGDLEVLCRYHVSQDYCLLYLRELIRLNRIEEARDLVEKLKEEGMNLEDILRSGERINPPFE